MVLEVIIGTININAGIASNWKLHSLLNCCHLTLWVRVPLPVHIYNNIINNTSVCENRGIFGDCSVMASTKHLQCFRGVRISHSPQRNTFMFS